MIEDQEFIPGGSWEDEFDSGTMQLFGIIQKEQLIGSTFDEDLEKAIRIAACLTAMDGVHINDIDDVIEKGGANKFFRDRVAYRDLCFELLEDLKAMSYPLVRISMLNCSYESLAFANYLSQSLTRVRISQNTIEKAEQLLGEKK